MPPWGTTMQWLFIIYCSYFIHRKCKEQSSTPNSVSLAIFIASSSVLKRTRGATGPKTSSLHKGKRLLYSIFLLSFGSTYNLQHTATRTDTTLAHYSRGDPPHNLFFFTRITCHELSSQQVSGWSNAIGHHKDSNHRPRESNHKAQLLASHLGSGGHPRPSIAVTFKVRLPNSEL